MPYWPSYRKSKKYFLTSENKILILSNKIKWRLSLVSISRAPPFWTFNVILGQPVSYWPIFFLSLVTVPEVFAWVNSAQFHLVSKVANVSLFLPVCCFHKWRSRGRWDRVCPWVPSYGRCGHTPITHLKLISTEIEVKQLPYSHGSSLRDVCYKSIPFCRVSVRLYSKVDVKVWY